MNTQRLFYSLQSDSINVEIACSLALNRDLQQQGRQRQGRRRFKNEYIFLVGISRMAGCAYHLLWRRKLTSA